MGNVSKLVILDQHDNYLMLYRDNHPVFGDDPDLPGGLIEDGESAIAAVAREIKEETGIFIDSKEIIQIYAGTEYSAGGGHFSLFTSKLTAAQEITLSWEHATYQWLPKSDFLKAAKSANDTYMHMVHDVVSKL